MAKYDIRRMREEHKITQQALADKLKVSQGFLSSVEKLRYPFPPNRVNDLQMAFPDIDISDYEISEEETQKGNVGSFNKDSDIDINDSEVLMQLLKIISESSNSVNSAREDEREDNRDWRKRCEHYMDETENLRKELYELRIENLGLKELLMENGIDYKEKVEKIRSEVSAGKTR